MRAVCELLSSWWLVAFTEILRRMEIGERQNILLISIILITILAFWCYFSFYQPNLWSCIFLVSRQLQFLSFRFSLSFSIYARTVCSWLSFVLLVCGALFCVILRRLANLVWGSFCQNLFSKATYSMSVWFIYCFCCLFLWCVQLYVWVGSVAYSGNAFHSINEVTLRRAGLVLAILGWVTAYGQINHLGM